MRAIALLLLLAGCSYALDQSRQVVEINGHGFAVVKAGPNLVTVNPWGVFQYPRDWIAYKHDQIAAAESVTGCKAVESATIDSQYYLQVQVDCSNPRGSNAPSASPVSD